VAPLEVARFGPDTPYHLWAKQENTAAPIGKELVLFSRLVAFLVPAHCHHANRTVPVAM